jgi:hypothetical protein
MRKTTKHKKEIKIVGNDIFKSKTEEERMENIKKIFIKYINS